MNEQTPTSAAQPKPAQASLPVQALAPAAPATHISSASLATAPSRLTKIEIKNYRGYRGTFSIELPKGENLLVYGENGAGKSSLYHTLRVFLEAPDHSFHDPSTRKPRALAVTDHRHRFTTDAPAIKLEFGGHSFAWSETTNDTGQSGVRLVNQGKGFLDYKALLGVHYVPLDQGIQIDVFTLTITRLLPYYAYPNRGQNLSFKAGWLHLHSSLRQHWFGRREEHFREDLAAFNDALARTIHDLGIRASTMLAGFGDEFAVEFHFEKAEFMARPKRIVGPRILVRPAFRKQQVQDYSSFFNEARLSALAICLFFAALKESPATGLRILALDDILIGLDMGNRLKVLELIHENFADWQVLLFTYSKAWFERLKERVTALTWAAPWRSVVLWEKWHEGENSPRILAEGSGDLLDMAEAHLQRKDYKAAAIYARSALEALCHRTCAKASLPVRHVDELKDRKLEDYIVVLERRFAELRDEGRRRSALKLVTRLREAQAFVLNQNSHFDVEEEDTLSAEVKAGIEVVRDLNEFLAKQPWKRANFKDGKSFSPTERLSIALAESRRLAAVHEPAAAMKKLVEAHELAWEAYGAQAKVCLPIGELLSAKIVWDAALAQTKLDAAFDVQLKAARPYLFGSVEDKSFDATKFEVAAKLLEKLAALGPT